RGDDPLLGFQVLADDAGAASKIVDKIVLRAKQENIRFLDNAVSPLKKQLQIKLIKIVVQGGKIVSQSDPINDGPQPLKLGQNFQLQLTNTTNPPKNIYVAVFMLGTSGSVELLTANPNGDLIAPGQSYVMHQVREVGPPLGRETYKF